MLYELSYSRQNDDLTGKLPGFEVMSDHVSTEVTEIGLAYEGRAVNIC